MNVCVISEKDPIFILYSFVGNHISEFYVYDVIHGKDEDKFKRVVSSWACAGDGSQEKDPYHIPSHISVEIESLDDFINNPLDNVVAIDNISDKTKYYLYIYDISKNA